MAMAEKRVARTNSDHLLARARGRPPKPPTPWAKTDHLTKSRYKTARAKYRFLNPTSMMQRTARRICRLRGAMKLSQSQFARQVGVTIRTLSRWENGKGHLPMRKCWKRILELERMNGEVLAQAKREGYKPDFKK
jgi:DNA-binding transcriptional regulator YiaG